MKRLMKILNRFQEATILSLVMFFFIFNIQ